jgi:hypothetical protein
MFARRVRLARGRDDKTAGSDLSAYKFCQAAIANEFRVVQHLQLSKVSIERIDQQRVGRRRSVRPFEITLVPFIPLAFLSCTFHKLTSSGYSRHWPTRLSRHNVLMATLTDW